MKSYIGYSIDSTIRYKASSGGVGSAIVKYLLDNGKCDYALSFEWDKLNLCYQPIFISDFSQYNICGSIYQEINIIDCVKNFLNTCNRGDKIVLFCLPCQTRALRHICDRAGLDTIIIGLTCSSQQSKDASLFLLNQTSFYHYKKHIRQNRTDIIRWELRLCLKDKNPFKNKKINFPH